MINPSTIAILLASLVITSSQAPITTVSEHFDALSNDDLFALATEVRQWHDTYAGQNAMQHGFMSNTAAKALKSLATTLPPGDIQQSKTAAQTKIKLGVSKIIQQSATSVSDNTMNATTASDPNLRELLKRYYDGKVRVAELAKIQPKATFSMQTQFALMTPDEFRAYVSRGKPLMPSDLILQNLSAGATLTSSRNLRQMVNPTSIDYAAAGKVSPVQDQGSCNACGFFSSIAAIESTYAIKTGNAVPSLSEQDVLSCGPNQGLCSNGIFVQDAFDWIINYNGGSVCTLDSFQYGGWNSATVWCSRYDDPSKACYKPDIGLVGYNANQFPNHLDLESAVASQPVAVVINSKPAWFQYYNGGILMGNENECPSDAANMNHAVTIVGYGTDNDGTNFWKAKNSWGHKWGEAGFLRIERGYQGATFGACGIERFGVYPVLRATIPSATNKRCAPKRVGHQTLGTVYGYELTNGVSACCNICRANPSCVAVNFQENGYECTLLSSVTGDQLVSGTSTILIRDKSQSDAMCTPVENNVDYGGNDLMRLMTTSAADCCDACMRNPSCTAYTWSQWNTGSCFLKTQRGSSINSHSPNGDGSPYYVSGESYKCQQTKSNTDIPGQDLSNAPAANAYTCCGICRATSGCAAFTWTNYNGGTCWLKTGSSNSASKNGATSASVFESI